jgi:hypothetical protein
MNTSIEENDCIVLQTEGSEVGKRGVGLAGSKDPVDAGAPQPYSSSGSSTRRTGRHLQNTLLW